MLRVSILFFLVISVVINQIESKKIRYDFYEVYRIIPLTDQQIEDLHEIQTNLHCMLWNSIRGPGQAVDIMVSPILKSQFLHTINMMDLKAEILIENVQQLIDNERLRVKAPFFDWTDYHDLDEINNWLLNLTEQYPDVASIINAGKSYEGRDLLGVHISFNGSYPKKSVFIEANIHAREWITSALATYFLNELLTSTNTTIRTLAESRDWYIVPVVNPDGFQYTHTTDRLWRKTRVPYGDCYGADGNRNWDYHFDEGGSSSDPCSNEYHGPEPFSEPSMKSLSEYITSIGDNLEAYIALHSYSQLLMTPYAFTIEHLDNYETLYSVGLKAANSLAQRYGTEYTVGTWFEILYPATGTSIDWVKGIIKPPIAYTYELRDKGEYGFILPADQILPTALETIDSFITIFEEFDKILS